MPGQTTQDSVATTSNQTARVPASLFILCFCTTRALEAIWIYVAFVAEVFIEVVLQHSPTEGWSDLSPARLLEPGLIALAWYYVGFFYFFISAIVMWAVRRYSSPLTASQYRNANVATFCVHSIAVILSFGGRMNITISAVWLGAVLYNAIIPSILWRSFFQGSQYSTAKV
jgi:hypothetical protein